VTKQDDTGTLTINSNAPARPKVELPLSGAAVATGPLELKVDDGTFEGSNGYQNGASNGHYLNRLTPPGYPATLTAVRVYFNARQGQVDPNTPINVLAAGNPTGSGTIDLLFLSGANSTVSAVGRFLEFPLARPITIESGDFVVGVSLSTGAGIFPLAMDTNSLPQGRSYISPDGVRFSVVTSANLGIRAQVTVGR